MGTSTKMLIIRNIGLILTGKIEAPIADGDCVIAVDGRISAIGYEKDLDTEGATTIVDANGCTIAPGLIDSHVHPEIGGYTPRQQHDDGLRGRGPYARTSKGQRLPQGDVECGPTLVREFPPVRGQGAGRGACDRTRHGGA